MNEDVSKHISTAKRLWNQSKRFIGKSDKIERAENALFVNDEALAQLVVEREQKEHEIIEYIENKLNDSRKVSALEDGKSRFFAVFNEEFIEEHQTNGDFRCYDNHTLLFHRFDDTSLELMVFSEDTDLRTVVSVLNYLEMRGVINFKDGDLQWFIQ
jgi:hypothetical protein